LSEGAVEALNLAARLRHKDGIVFLNPEGQPIEEKPPPRGKVAVIAA